MLARAFGARMQGMKPKSWGPSTDHSLRLNLLNQSTNRFPCSLKTSTPIAKILLV